MAKKTNAKPAETAPQKSQELAIVETAIANMSAVDQGISELREKFSGVIFEVKTTKGMDAAKAARLSIREPRFNVEHIRKGAKAPINALGRKIDEEAKRITSALMEIEEPIDAQIVAEENRKEAEKQARIQAEAARVQGITDTIEAIRRMVDLPVNPSPEVVADKIAFVERLEIDARFEEFERQAHDARGATLGYLRQTHTEAVDRLAREEQARKDREELEELRRRNSEREAADRKAQQERDAADRRDREAEQDRRERIEFNRQVLESCAAKSQLEGDAVNTVTGEWPTNTTAISQRGAAGTAALMREILDDVPRYSCFVPGCPGRHGSKYMVCVQAGGTVPTLSASIAPSFSGRPSFEEIVRWCAFHFDTSEDVVRSWISENIVMEAA